MSTAGDALARRRCGFCAITTLMTLPAGFGSVSPPRRGDVPRRPDPYPFVAVIVRPGHTNALDENDGSHGRRGLRLRDRLHGHHRDPSFGGGAESLWERRRWRAG